VIERSFDTAPPGSRPAERLAAVSWLDAPARILANFSSRQRGPLADLARGKPLGHPLHPALTDLPIGFWTSSLLLDVVGGRRFAGASRALVGVGVISAVPTIAAGLADLPALTAHKRRVAVVHAASNAVATMLYVKSWSLRKRHRIVGVGVGLAAATTATIGGYLGGWLAFGEVKPRDRSTARSQVA
jgi:uncharacterized membrane protein